MRSSLVRRWVFLATLAAGSACHDIPQAPITRPTPGPEWIRITMDDGVTDYPSFGGLDLLRDADGGVHIISAETEFGRLRYSGCVQNCQDPARWFAGTVDSGDYRGLGENASSALTSSGIQVAYEEQASGAFVKFASCPGSCFLPSNWRSGILFRGLLGSYNGTHSRALAADTLGGLHLLYRNVRQDSLSYATCTSNCTDSSSWQRVLLDRGAFTFADAAIAVGPTGAVDVLVQSLDTAMALTFFTCTAACATDSSWRSLVLDHGATGATPSILVGADGGLHISYRAFQGAPDANLVRYGTCASNCLIGASWTLTTLGVTTGSDVGLALDASGAPWIATSRGIISGYDGVTTIVHCSSDCGGSGAWTTTLLDSLGDGLDIAILLDATGAPRIAVSGFGVHYAQRPDTTVLLH